MALPGLTGRFSRAESRLNQAALTFMAQRMATEIDVPFDACYTELRGLFRAIGRLGPNPNTRAMARVISQRYGSDEEQIYRKLFAARKGRAG